MNPLPKVVHLVCAHESNYPWGFENRIIATLERMGIDVIATDYRLRRAALPSLLAQPADFLLVCKGEGIPADLIRRASCPTALWYAEQIGTMEQCDAAAGERRRELAGHGPAFDAVFVHEPGAVLVAQTLGCTRVGCLPTACVDSLNVWRNEDFSTEMLGNVHPTEEGSNTVEAALMAGRDPAHEVLFVGRLTPRRRQFLETLKRTLHVHVVEEWAPDRLATLMRQSRIVLNLHLSDLPNTETRVGEVLGAGAFLLTEELSAPELLQDGEHAAIFPLGDVAACAAKAKEFLADDERRRSIARTGAAWMLGRHRLEDRLRALVAMTPGEARSRRWPGETLGVLRNKWGDETPLIGEFEAAVESQLAIAGIPAAPLPTWPVPRAKELVRRPGRVFAAFANVNWEEPNLSPALAEFGDVVRYDWGGQHDQYAPTWPLGDKKRMNEELLAAARQAHDVASLDWAFTYVSGRLVYPETIYEIEAMGIPTLNLSLDDRTKFRGGLEATGHSGMIDIASAFTLCWTSSPEAVAWYVAAGARAIFLPPGANPAVYRPLTLERDLDVVFVGQCYGIRPALVETLRQAGVRVDAFGVGWPNGPVSTEEMITLISRAKVALGVGAIGDSADTLILKGRDFEIPMAGACYLTQHNPTLGSFFALGEEIETYRDADDLVAKARELLASPDRAGAMRRRARIRSLREHTWARRFRTALEAMERLASDRSRKGVT